VLFKLSEVQVERLKQAAEVTQKVAKSASKAYGKAELATIVADSLEGAAEEAITFLDRRLEGKCEPVHKHCDALATGIRRIISDLSDEADSLDSRAVDSNEVREGIKSYRNLLSQIAKGATDPELAFSGPPEPEEAQEDQRELATR
jgi:hypothetical protein